MEVCHYSLSCRNGTDLHVLYDVSSRTWTTSVVHHYKCDGRASSLLSISLLQKLFVVTQELVFLLRQSVVFSYHCVDGSTSKSGSVALWSHFIVTCHASIHLVEWGMFVLYTVHPCSVTNGWFPELSVSFGVGSDFSFFCLTTLSISEVYITWNKTMSKEWCGKWCAWMCKKNGNLSLWGPMLTGIMFKYSVRTAQ